MPATISRLQLSEFLRRAGLGDTTPSELSSPYLPLNDGDCIDIIRGQHRLVAAGLFLQPIDQWWVVDLYDNDILPVAIQNLIREDYRHAQEFDDGYIFCAIRANEEGGNKVGADKWKARLTTSKLRDLKQLQTSRFLDLSKAFDQLRQFPGLWQSLKIGTFHRLLTMRCLEELVTYLATIRETWSAIMETEMPSLLDAESVRLLQGRCPRLSVVDSTMIHQAIETGKLFPFINEPYRRSAIRERVLRCKTLIPTLHTFLEDSKFLEPSAKILRTLLPPVKKSDKHKCTIREGLQACFTPPTSQIIQKHENKYVTIDVQLGFWAAYRQLWLFALRHFPYYGGTMPRIDPHFQGVYPKIDVTELNYRLGSLAKDLGFASEEVTKLINVNASHHAFRSLINDLRPPSQFEVDATMVQNEALHFGDILKSTRPRETHYEYPLLTVDSSEEWRLDFRCGRMYDGSFTACRSHFFLDRVYSTAPIAPRLHVTTIYVSFAIFRAFFGFETPQGWPDDHRREYLPPNETIMESNFEAEMDLMTDQLNIPPSVHDISPGLESISGEHTMTVSGNAQSSRKRIQSDEEVVQRRLKTNPLVAVNVEGLEDVLQRGHGYSMKGKDLRMTTLARMKSLIKSNGDMVETIRRRFPLWFVLCSPEEGDHYVFLPRQSDSTFTKEIINILAAQNCSFHLANYDQTACRPLPLGHVHSAVRKYPVFVQVKGHAWSNKIALDGTEEKTLGLPFYNFRLQRWEILYGVPGPDYQEAA